MPTKNSVNNATGDLTVDPGASGDSFVQFDINATGEFRIGVDDDDGDEFKISQGSALGTNDTVTITSDGEMREPFTPAVNARTATTGNQTGDGTLFTINWSTEIFDQGSNLSGTTFTAPITGKYRIISFQLLNGVTALHTTGNFEIVTSNRTYRAMLATYSIRNPNSNSMDMGSNAVLADMDASDTATITVTVSNSGLTVGPQVISATDPRGGIFCVLAV